MIIQSNKFIEKKNLFIFGSTGDLVKRKVLPALEKLNKKDLKIWAIGRKNISTKKYLDLVYGKKVPDYLKKSIYYQKTSFNDNICEECVSFFSKKNTNYIYISTPPFLISGILKSIAKFKKNNIKFKILIEKPFGESLKHALQLRNLIKKLKLDEDIFLSDHYLFKKDIIDLKQTEFNNLIITSIENVGLENRITYYDKIGALKDMIQSHFFNIVFRIVKNPGEFKNIKIVKYVKGQYGNGKTNGYVSELGKKSKTETFVFLKVEVNNQTFTFITGKGFKEKEGSLKIDDKVIKIKTGKEYQIIFKNFFENKKEKFPKIKNAILSWEVIEKINQEKVEFKYYKKDISYYRFFDSLKTTKEKILTKALKLFVKQGVNKTSTNQITKEVGIATGTLFVHFKTKQELIEELYVEINKKIYLILKCFIKPDLPAKRNLQILLEKLFNFFINNYDEFSFIKLIENNPQVSKKIMKEKRKKSSIIRNSIKKWKNKGELKNIDEEVIEKIIWGLLFVYVNNYKKIKNEKLKKNYLNVLWDAIGNK